MKRALSLRSLTGSKPLGRRGALSPSKRLLGLCDKKSLTLIPAMPLPLTRLEKIILGILAGLIVLGLIGLAVL